MPRLHQILTTPLDCCYNRENSLQHSDIIRLSCKIVEVAYDRRPDNDDVVAVELMMIIWATRPRLRDIRASRSVYKFVTALSDQSRSCQVKFTEQQ